MNLTNAKKYFKKIEKVIIVVIIFLIVIVDRNYVDAQKIKREKVSIKTEDNRLMDLKDKKGISQTIKNLILTINSEGIDNKLLSYTSEIYINLNKEYNNIEIVEFINESINEIEKENQEINKNQVDRVIRLLINMEESELIVLANKIIDQAKEEKSVKKLCENVINSMTYTEKISFIIKLFISQKIFNILIFMIILLFAYKTLLRCVIYKKAGENAWASFVPIYRNIIMLKICNMSSWWLLLLLVPVLGWLLLWIVIVASKFMLAESFNKGTVFAFGLCILPIVYETYLVFSKKTQYVGFDE